MYIRVFVNERVVLKVIKLLNLKMFIKHMENLIPIKMKITSFVGVVSNASCVLITSMLLVPNKVR